MPQYYFDLHNDVDACDNDGKELPDLDAAIENSLHEAREMIKPSIDDTGRINLRHRIDIRDDRGSILHTTRFEEAISVQRGEQFLSRPAALSN